MRRGLVPEKQGRLRWKRNLHRLAPFSRVLTCELTPDNVLNFSYEHPFAPEAPDVGPIKGSQTPDGQLTGEQHGIGEDGKAYVIQANEGTLAGNDLAHDTLPRIAQKCREALKP